MNCSPTIAIALLLLSLTAGAWLLYKTQKESLGALFKVIAWFVIVISIASMVCCGMRCVFHCCKQNQECGRTEQCEMNKSECNMESEHCRMGHRGMGERIIIMKGGEDGECEMMGKGCCKDKMECKEGKEGCEEGKMDCCKKGGAKECEMGEVKKCDMKGMMKKDSVVKKK